MVIKTEKGLHADPNEIKDKFQLGTKLFGQYEIFEKHKGGMSIVLIVEDVTSKEVFAVKTIPSLNNLDDRELATTKFLNEIYSWFLLPPHKNIIQPKFVKFLNGQPLLFMEYIEGNINTLRSLIGNLTIFDCLNIAYQICSAMVFVNKQNPSIIHSDLKPENILISQNQTVKVTDFGLANLYSHYDGLFPTQKSGSIPYMSPEQVRNEVVDEYSDIFSFGIILYEMATGNLPHPFDYKKISTSTEWRQKLLEFYARVQQNQPELYSSDDYRKTPWKAISREDVQENLKQMILACIMLRPLNRWRGFKELYNWFSLQFKDFIRPEFRQAGSQEANQEYLSYEHRKALAFHKIGKLHESQNAFNDAIVSEPHNASIWRDAAMVLIEQGKISDGKSFLERAIALDKYILIDDEMAKILE